MEKLYVDVDVFFPTLRTKKHHPILISLYYCGQLVYNVGDKHLVVARYQYHVGVVGVHSLLHTVYASVLVVYLLENHVGDISVGKIALGKVVAVNLGHVDFCSCAVVNHYYRCVVKTGKEIGSLRYRRSR